MIDFKKPLMTRDGREVRIYTTEHPTDHPVVGALKTPEGRWYVWDWDAHGLSSCTSGPTNSDLVNVPETKIVKGWAILGEDFSVSVRTYQPSRGTCNALSAEPIEITFTLGEGLDNV